MRYLKLDHNGSELPDSATSWVMIKDTVTGFIWASKTNDGSALDRDNTYTWFDSDPTTNGGYAGTQGDGTDTEDFLKSLNSVYHGGYSDWRLPTVAELQTLWVDGQKHIDWKYFDTVFDYHWTSQTYEYPGATDESKYARLVDGEFGGANCLPKSEPLSVRAIRAAPNPAPNLDAYPSNISVTAESGVAVFGVSNTGTGTMAWIASVISDSSWLTAGGSGTNTGVINCSFTANTLAIVRTATVRVTATGAAGSPKDVTVTQFGTQDSSNQPISTKCRMLVGEFDKLAGEVTALAKAPQKMIATLNGMIKNAKADTLGVAVGMFDDLKAEMIASLGLSGISDTFSELEGWMETIQDSLDSIGTAGFALPKCIKSILSNPLIEAAIGIDLASMSGVTDISKITGRLKALAIGQIQANAMAFLDQGMAKMGIGGLIAGAEMGYKKMLKSSGILDGIDLMNDLAECMGTGCDAVGGVAGGYSLKIEEMMTGMNMTIDQDVTDLWAESTGDLPDLKAAISDTVAQGNAIAAKITSWDGSSALDFDS